MAHGDEHQVAAAAALVFHAEYLRIAADFIADMQRPQKLDAAAGPHAARDKGYVETVFGRRLWATNIRSGNKARQQGAELSVPLVVDVGVGANWDEAH